MDIRDRITQFQDYLTRQIKFSAGNRLLGRVTGAGKGQEIEVGAGLEFDGTTLNATGSQPGHVHTFESLTAKPTTVGGYGITDAGPALTFAGVDPNIPEVLTISGTLAQEDTTPIITPVDLPRIADTNGYASWSDTFDVAWSEGYWQVITTGFFAQINDASITPIGLEGWDETTGTGQPVITGDNPIGQYLGQLCKTSAGWWRWNGTLWESDIASTLTSSKSVANAAARLALTTELAEGFAVVDADTGKTWMLVAGGTPATSGDWLQLGDRDIQWADVGGKPAFGTASLANSADFATAAQGHKADTALRSPSYQTWTAASNIASLGDSITIFDGKNSVYNRVQYMSSWLNWLNIFLNQRITWTRNPATDVYHFGVGGNTAEQILARVPDVLATAADTVLVMAGANNIINDTPAVLAPKVVAIWDAIITGGKQVMATEILPLLATTKNARVSATNDILRIEAAKRGIPFVVWGNTMRSGPYARADLFTNGALNDIGVHPGNFGGPVIGRVAAEQLDKWIQPTEFAIPAAGLVTAAGSWVTRNAYMTGGTTLPTDWAAAAFGAGVGTLTTEKRIWTGSDVPYTWLKCALTAGPLTSGCTLQAYQAAGQSGLVANDWVRCVARIMIHPRSYWQSFNIFAFFAGDSAVCANYGLFDSGTGAAQIIPDGVHDGLMTGIVLGPKTQVTTNAAAGIIYSNLTMYGYGTAQVAQMGLIKTTAP